MNVIARLELKPAYYNSTVQRFNHSTSRKSLWVRDNTLPLTVMSSNSYQTEDRRWRANWMKGRELPKKSKRKINKLTKKNQRKWKGRVSCLWQHLMVALQFWRFELCLVGLLAGPLVFVLGCYIWPNALITMCITVTFMFHSFFSSLARSKYFIIIIVITNIWYIIYAMKSKKKKTTRKNCKYERKIDAIF